MSAKPVVPTQSPEPPKQSTPAASPKLAKSAREFEAILLQSWMEKMNQSFVGLEDSQDAAHDTISSLGTQAIAGALAARGGIGIANMILRQIQPSAIRTNADTGDASTTVSPHQKLKLADSTTEGAVENRTKTLKSSHELPITELQGNTLREVER